MTDKINYAATTIDDIVFEGRNKDYGAYELRKIYSKYATRGLIIAVVSFIAFVLLAQVDYSFLKKKNQETEISVETTDVDLPKDQPVDPTKPPPPPPPPPPQAPQMKFVEMVVKKDEQVADDEVHSQEELQEPKQISNQDKEGDNNASFVPKDPEVPAGNGPAVTEPAPIKEEPKEDEIFNIVEEKPSFPGGMEELYKYLGKNIRFPPFATESGISGKVQVSFVVEKDGSITDIKILKDIGGGCGEEAIRVIKSMPKWIPGKQRGMPVRVRFSMPVLFKLN